VTSELPLQKLDSLQERSVQRFFEPIRTCDLTVFQSDEQLTNDQLQFKYRGVEALRAFLLLDDTEQQS